MLILRAAQPHDLIPLAALMDDYKDTFLDDYSEYDHELLARILVSGECLVISDGSYAVGVLWFHSRVDDLHVSVSILVRPKYLKAVLRLGLITKALSQAFDTWKVRKIKASPMKTQQGAIKLLKRHGFVKVAKLPNETRHNGKKVDVLWYELYRKYFSRQERQ